MAGIHYLSFLPAENPVHRSQGVNLLLMVDNPGEDAAVTVRFYGSDGSDWREIFAEERSFQGHSHIHAYFHLPPACFAPENWGGETLEELAVWGGRSAPRANGAGTAPVSGTMIILESLNQSSSAEQRAFFPSCAVSKAGNIAQPLPA